MCVGVVVGVGVGNEECVKVLVEVGVDVFFIDLFYGYFEGVLNCICEICVVYFEFDIIGGNVVIGVGVKVFIEVGVSVVKVGIGFGFICIICIVIGVGVF